MSDYRDLVIAHFADDERDLLERLAHVEDERETYRALAQQAIHALHDLTQSQQRLREQHERLLDEYRQLREQVMRQDAA